MECAIDERNAISTQTLIAGIAVVIVLTVTFVERSKLFSQEMNSWYYLSVWLHVLGATFWIGGMLFLPLVLLPSIKNNYDRSQLLISTGLKFRFYGYIVLAMMFVTGLLNMGFKGADFSWKFFNQTHYGRLVAVKIILLVCLVLISLTHDVIAAKKFPLQLQPEQSKKLKLITRWTGRVLLFISLIMAYIGVLLSRGA